MALAALRASLRLVIRAPQFAEEMHGRGMEFPVASVVPGAATLLVSGNNISVIRRAETLEDVFRRDVIPEHLKGKGSDVSTAA